MGTSGERPTFLLRARPPTFRCIDAGGVGRTGTSPYRVPFGTVGRLAASLPPLDDEVRRLATLYTCASFRRGGLRADELVEARQAWSRIRGSYPGLVAKAWRDALRQGRVLKEEDAASVSRAPSRRR